MAHSKNINPNTFDNNLLTNSAFNFSKVNWKNIIISTFLMLLFYFLYSFFNKFIFIEFVFCLSVFPILGLFLSYKKTKYNKFKNIKVSYNIPLKSLDFGTIGEIQTCFKKGNDYIAIVVYKQNYNSKNKVYSHSAKLSDLIIIKNSLPNFVL